MIVLLKRRVNAHVLGDTQSTEATIGRVSERAHVNLVGRDERRRPVNVQLVRQRKRSDTTW
jgi:hypothetical protein